MSRRKKQPPLRGVVRVPGDKSVSHRAVILAALATGTSIVRGLNGGRDVAATADIVGALGARVERDEDNDEVRVEGWGTGGPREPSAVLDAGNSGTTARLILGVCARYDVHAVVTGDAALRQRPMLRVVAPLRQMGARLDGRSHGDRLPIAVRGTTLQPLDHRPDVASAQVKSAVLLAGLGADGDTTVVERAATRDHTERMLEVAGVRVRRDGLAVTVSGPAHVEPTEWRVGGDPSAAMFLIVAATLVPDSELTIRDVDLNPGRIAALDTMRSMGADIDVLQATETAAGDPIGDLVVRSAPLKGVTLGPDEVPSVIDELPALAIAASQADGVTVITGAHELRAKESDRLSALATGLRSLGATVEETRAGLVIEGPTRLAGAEIETFGDHRIAMAFAVAGLVAQEKVRVKDWSSVDVSFPGFADVLADASA